MDRLQQIFRAAEHLTLSKNQAIILVGGRSRLERLEAEGRIRKVKRTGRQNCRWECNAADVLRYTVVEGEAPLPNYTGEMKIVTINKHAI